MNSECIGSAALDKCLEPHATLLSACESIRPTMNIEYILLPRWAGMNMCKSKPFNHRHFKCHVLM